MAIDERELELLDRDARCPLAGFRDEFLIPTGSDGRERVYLCGHSLGLQPRAAATAVQRELERWATLAVDGHFRGDPAWMDYPTRLAAGLAELVGALPAEVVVMNSLTVNLHLMLASFYRPTRARAAILIERHAFPSDRHAVESQIRWHGYDPAQELIELAGDCAHGTLSQDAIARALDAHGHRIALVLLPGVQYLTGQAFDLAAITRLAHRHGCSVGFDLAHAVGNLPLALHEANVDFAVWCHYKYLNGGPGAIGGCFVHARHALPERPRLAGWWGHDAATRFRMAPEFVPADGAAGFQLSTPPILAMAPLSASLELFQRAGMARLREKSLALTGWLAETIARELDHVLEIATPADPAQRGCQLSLKVRGSRDEGRALFEHLDRDGITADWREPNTIRVAPVPLYNRYLDLLRFVRSVQHWAATR